MIFELAQDLRVAVAAMPKEHMKHRMLELLEEAIRRDIHFIARHPTSLFQCMWNTCWWYDCPDAADHYESKGGAPGERRLPPSATKPADPHVADQAKKMIAAVDQLLSDAREGKLASRSDPFAQFVKALSEGGALIPPKPGTASAEQSAETPAQPPPPWIRSDAQLHLLLEEWRCERGRACSRPWVRSLRPPPIHLGTAQRAIFRGHLGGVKCIAFSPDGTLMASGGSDGTLRVWDLHRGELRSLLTFERSTFDVVRFSPDGKCLFSLSVSDNSFRIWSLATSTLILTLGFPGSVMAMSPNGCLVATRGCSENTLDVWDVWGVNKLAPLCSLRGHEDYIHAVEFFPDSSRLASGSGDHGLGRDRAVRIWDIKSGEQLCHLGPCAWEVTAVAISPTQRYVASGGNLGELRLWEVTESRLAKANTSPAGLIRAITFSADGTRVATAHDDDDVRVWETSTLQQLARLSGHEGVVTTLAFSSTDMLLASGSEDGTIRIWGSESIHMSYGLRGHKDRITSISLLPTTSRLITTCGRDKVTIPGMEHRPRETSVRIWNSSNACPLFLLEGHRFSPVACSSLDESRVVSCDWRSIRIWDTHSGACLAEIEEERIGRITYSPDGNRIAGVLGSADEVVVKLWDGTTLEPKGLLKGHKGEITAIAFDHGGGMLATASKDRAIRLWDLTSATVRRCFQIADEIITHLVFSADDVELVVGTDQGSVGIWDCTRGVERHHFTDGIGNVIDLRYGADGQHLAASFAEKITCLWDVESGRCIERCAGHRDVVALLSSDRDFPVQVISEALETRFVSRRTGGEIARLGHAMLIVVQCPRTRVCYGTSAYYLHATQLEDYLE